MLGARFWRTLCLFQKGLLRCSRELREEERSRYRYNSHANTFAKVSALWRDCVLRDNLSAGTEVEKKIRKFVNLSRCYAEFDVARQC